MPGDDLKKVQRGQALRIPAAAYNSFIDAAADYRNRTLGIGGQYKQRDTRTGVILVRNDSGGTQEQFAVLGIDDIVISPDDNEREFRNRIVLSGVTPVADDHKGRFVILVEPIEAGKIGRAVIDGISAVKIDVADEEEEPRFVEVTEGSTASLTVQRRGSAAILWRAGGTGSQWAVVRLGKPTPLHVFPVDLTQVSGTQGTETSAASWTYDVLDVETGETLESAVDPTASPHKWQRPSIGQMIAATFGYAHYQDDGYGGEELVLGWINEIVDQEACETSGSGSGG